MYIRCVKRFWIRKYAPFISCCALGIVFFQFFLRSKQCGSLVSRKTDAYLISQKEVNNFKKVWMVEQQSKMFDIAKSSEKALDLRQHKKHMWNSANPLDCLVNEKNVIQCLVMDHEQVYMPFRFISKYFEVHGEKKIYNGYERLQFSQSRFKVCLFSLC